MELKLRTEDGVVVVDVIGNVSGSTDEESELTSMMSDFSSRGETLFVVNLDNILSFDEPGMRMLLRVCTSVHRDGGHMVFVRSVAEGTNDRDLSPDEDKLVFESERRAINALKRRKTAD
jgi:anti-anti-sigma factor